MKALISEYNKKKSKIKKRLQEFECRGRAKDEDIFEELCFCLFTPQSKAVSCDKALKRLRKRGLLLKGSGKAVRGELSGVRFPNNKTAYLLAARKLFKEGKGIGVTRRIDKNDIIKTREWLVENVKGFGYKEASHFLRNIGLGKDLAILDVHILRNLKKCGVIKEFLTSISRKRYMEIEDKMRAFAKRLDIPLGELDLLFWSMGTGIIFK
ncbi:MAG: N-glycosylase/DNA lyase [Candidatus Omnitrophica bacterium]|nr:N-glycosylase/DNA lyase [Candidatus Omnitrophota bacterium]